MSLTEQQKAYHVRKMRTRLARLDANKDGVISQEDFDLMSERMCTHGKLNEEQVSKIKTVFKKLAEFMKIGEGAKISAAKFSDIMLSFSSEDIKQKVEVTYVPLFEALDFNGDGYISMEEFKIYLKGIAPDVTEEEAEHAFNTIDTNKNKEISREEFIAASKDFFFGVEDTEVSRAFMGKLLD